MNVESNTIYGVIIAIIGFLGSNKAYKLYEKKMSDKRKEKDYIQDDCHKRIEKLEILLDKGAEEKDRMMEKIITLTQEVSSLKTEVEYLKKENERLIILTTIQNK